MAIAADDNDPRYRSASFLAAAKALAAAQKADAELIVAYDKAAMVRANARADYLLGELALLVRAYGALTKTKGAANCGVAAVDCALPIYIASWNDGRIPVEVLDGRDLQAARELALQRQETVAAQQRAILLAASTSLKAYADGGIQPQTLARVAQSVGLIAATAAK
jgi:hypothetical protein